MNPQDPGLLWTISLALVLASAVVVPLVLLRLPRAILDLRTRVSAVEQQIALMDATVKKAARRAGLAEKKAAASPAEPTPDFLSTLPAADEGAPPHATGGAPNGGSVTLDDVRSHFRRR